MHYGLITFHIGLVLIQSNPSNPLMMKMIPLWPNRKLMSNEVENLTIKILIGFSSLRVHNSSKNWKCYNRLLMHCKWIKELLHTHLSFSIVGSPDNLMISLTSNMLVIHINLKGKKVWICKKLDLLAIECNNQKVCSIIFKNLNIL